jgi:hypothetical protein
MMSIESAITTFSLKANRKSLKPKSVSLSNIWHSFAIGESVQSACVFMAKGLVIHIEDDHDQRVEVWTEEHLRIGAAPDCDIRLRDSDWEAAGVALELARSNGHFRVVSLTAQGVVTHRRKPLTTGTSVDDGGAVRVGNSPLSVRFLPFNPTPTALVGLEKTALTPFVEETALEAATLAQGNDAIYFVRELTRELWRELSVKVRLVLVGLPLLLLTGLTVLGVMLYRERRRSLDTIASQSQQLGEQNQQIKEMERQMGDAGKRLDYLDKSRKDFQERESGRQLPTRRVPYLRCLSIARPGHRPAATLPRKHHDRRGRNRHRRRRTSFALRSGQRAVSRVSLYRHGFLCR